MQQASEEISKILDDPIAFMRFVTHLEPYEYQAMVLLSQAKRITFRSGRQVGKSTIMAMKALHKAFIKPYQCILVIAAAERQAKLLFQKIKEFIDGNDYIKSKVLRETMTEVTFDNGSTIYCLPSGHTGYTVRGFSADLIICDEAAFIPDQVYLAIEPSLAVTGGDLIFLSTPFGKRGRFYETFQSEVWEQYHVKSNECPSITDEFLESMRREHTETEYQQEYEGEFISEADAYFPRELIMKCIKDVEEKYVPDNDKEYFLGVDFARYGTDETVYMILEVDKEGKGTIVRIISTAKKPLTDALGRILELNATWHFKNIYLDETGLGGGAVDVLKEEMLPITAITFTLESKMDMYKNSKWLMEKDRIILPRASRFIMQLADLQYEYTLGAKLKLHAPDRGHDDFPDAFALVCQGMAGDEEKMVLLDGIAEKLFPQRKSLIPRF